MRDAVRASAWLEPLGEAAASLPFRRRVLRFGDELWAADTVAPGLAVVAHGRARLVAEVAGQEAHVLSVGPGDTLGLISLLRGGAEPLVCRGSSGFTEVWMLDPEQARSLLEQPEVRAVLLATAERQRMLLGLRRLPGLADVPDDAIVALGDAAELLEIPAGATLAPAVTRRPGDFEAVLDGELQHRRTDGARTLLTADVVFPSSLDGDGDYRAVRTTTLVRVGHEATHALVQQFPELAEALRPEHGAEQHVATVAVARTSVVDEALTGELEPGPRRARIRRMPWVQQMDVSDCGAACLAMVCRYFGRKVSIHLLRRLLYAGKDGITLRALCHASRQLGLAARSAKVSLRNLDELPLPAVLHLDGNHWAVLYDVTRRHVYLADPAVGHVRVGRDELEARWDGFAALFDYTEDFLQAPTTRWSSAWLWPFIRPWVGTIGRALLLAGVVSVVEGALPICTQVIIDSVLVDRDLPLLVTMSWALAAALVFLTISMLLQRYLLSFVAVRIDGGTLDFLARKLLDLRLSYFEARKIGDIRRRLEGVRAVREFVVGNAIAVLTAVARLAAALLLLGVYSSTLLGLFALTLPLYAVVMRISAGFLGPLFNQLERGFSEYDSHQIDAIRGIETVKAMGAEAALRQRMLEAFHKLAARQFRADFSLMAYDAGVGALNFLVVGTFLVVGAWQTIEGELTVGALVAVNTLVAMASGPIATILRAWDDAQRARVLLDRIQDVLVEEPEQGRDRRHLIPVAQLAGDVRIAGMSFAFPSVDTRMVLSNIDLHIRPGTTVALVGRSGSGKTTLAKCIAGLYLPSQGRIFVDGMDLARMNLADYRRHIGFVLQDTHLFDGTIASNIALNDEAPDMERVVHAAETAGAAIFIEELPLGYETRIGEGGMGLSGGQTQRLSLARALYHDPRILILDEATSSLDLEAELTVLDNLRAWRAQKTCIIVAHRLSTVRDADLTVVLEQGRIVEQGTHQELLARRGLYHHLYGEERHA